MLTETLVDGGADAGLAAGRDFSDFHAKGNPPPDASLPARKSKTGPVDAAARMVRGLGRLLRVQRTIHVAAAASMRSCPPT
mmetsp:Transcript_18140/g.56657  ORF Transcript_18140/g.56657 Transcript_18140/m.56657 type:complete len:81 (+) Transcript_18140:189-431(+)